MNGRAALYYLPCGQPLYYVCDNSHLMPLHYKYKDTITKEPIFFFFFLILITKPNFYKDQIKITEY